MLGAWGKSRRLTSNHRQQPILTWSSSHVHFGSVNSSPVCTTRCVLGVLIRWDALCGCLAFRGRPSGFLHIASLLLTYLLTPWSRILLDKLTASQLVKKFPAFYGTRKFITAVTSARHLSLSWAISIQSIPPHPTSCRSSQPLCRMIIQWPWKWEKHVPAKRRKKLHSVITITQTSVIWAACFDLDFGGYPIKLCFIRKRRSSHDRNGYTEIDMQGKVHHESPEEE